MTSLLMGSIGDSISSIEIVNLHITFTDEPYFKTILTKFMMVDIPLVYNATIG